MLDQQIAEMFIADALQRHLLTRWQGSSGGGCGHEIMENGVILPGLQGLSGLSRLADVFFRFQVRLQGEASLLARPGSRF